MKQTIVAIVNCNLYQNREQINNLSNQAFAIDAASKQNGCYILSLKEFERLINDDEFNLETSVIRFIEAELEVVRCK